MALRLKAARPHSPDPQTVLELKRGAKLKLERRQTEYAGWIWSTSDQNVSAWVPESWVKTCGDTCIMLRDYVSREISLDIGDAVRCDITESGWAWVHKENGSQGWVPLKCLKRVREIPGRGESTGEHRL